MDHVFSWHETYTSRVIYHVLHVEHAWNSYACNNHALNMCGHIHAINMHYSTAINCQIQSTTVKATHVALVNSHIHYVAMYQGNTIIMHI